jgi:hypothetical protein
VRAVVTDVAVTDGLTDSRPRDALLVHERHAAMPEIVRREHRHGGGRRSASDRRAEPVGPESLEDAPL